MTGSRIRRDEFTSAAPLQVYSIDAAKQTGISTVSELLQRSTIANGQQLDGTLNTNSGNSNASAAPAPGGVGSANIGLRGLGPERTLILVNGRRLGSSGVRGAPAQPDINLLPINMIERVEVITEGASSVYGADAVAGVVNVILRDEFEGFELTLNAEQPQDAGGEIGQLSFITGASSDRARFTISGEVFSRNRVLVGDRYDCLRTIEQTQDGSQRFDFCRNGFFDNAVAEFVTAGSSPTGDFFFFYTPGQTDVGIPNWSSALALPLPTQPNTVVDRPNQRDRFVFIPFYSDEDERRRTDLVAPIDRISFVAQGAYEPEWFGSNQELYFESYYLDRKVNNRETYEQVFPTIPGMIPQEDANGNIIVDATGAPILVDNPLNPFPGNATVVVTMDDSPQTREVQLQHYRFVGGLRGDLPGGWFEDNNWSYDVFASYDRGTGFSSQALFNENSVNLATQTLRLDANGNPICGVPVSGDTFAFLSPQPCVPVNFFADSVFTGGPTGEGVFATQAERDFILGTRTNRTQVEQAMYAGYVTGDLFTLPTGGTSAFAFGLEYRVDTIRSAADFLGVTGAVGAENPLAEGETVGQRNIFDAYAEVNIPLIVERPGIELLEFEAAVRYTQESNFGNETTNRFRLSYRPVDWITISSSFGTSFRAPNLREQFLADQFTGVGGDSDPCAVPGEANNSGVYDPTQDGRSQTTIDNCILSGADPTQLGLQVTTTIPITIGGNASSLEAETSDSFTATLQVSPPISDDWALDFAISYFDIEIEDTVRSLPGTTIMTRCFEDAPNLSSPFCTRLSRGQGGFPLVNFVNSIDASFVNVGLETSKGIDVNTRLYTNIRGWDLGWTNGFTYQKERTEQIFDGDIVDNIRGDFGNPINRYTSTVTAGRGNWEFLWQARTWSGTSASAVARIDAECDTFDDNDEIAGTDLTGPICSVDSQWYHDIAASYTRDTWLISAGINNVADEAPPVVDRTVGSNRFNHLTSSGYDQFWANLVRERHQVLVSVTHQAGPDFAPARFFYCLRFTRIDAPPSSWDRK